MHKNGAKNVNKNVIRLAHVTGRHIGINVTLECLMEDKPD